MLPFAREDELPLSLAEGDGVGVCTIVTVPKTVVPTPGTVLINGAATEITETTVVVKNDVEN